VIVPQFVELDIFLEALQRSVARELLEAGDVHAGGDAARDRPAPEAVAGEGRPVKPGEAGPVLTISAIESVSIGSPPTR